jgi:glucuronate isomerase
LDANTADYYFDSINAALATPSFRPRALFEQFNIEVLATTEAALDSLDQHRAIAASGWPGRVITTFRPDDVTDPERPDFVSNVQQLGELTHEDSSTWRGYLAALRKRRSICSPTRRNGHRSRPPDSVYR